MPRVQLTATGDIFPSGGAHVAGMTVYNINTIGNVTPGYYYNDGTQWVRIAAASVPSNDWTLLGNTGTTAGTNFLGTTDNISLRFKTNSTDRFEMTTTGNLRAFINGTQAAPAYSWTSNVGTGMFQQTANVLGFSTNGIERFRIPNSNQVHALSNGTNTAPFYSWSANSSTGMFQQAANVIGFSTNGTERFRIPNANQVHAVQSGTAELPSYSWSLGENMGMWRAATNILAFSTTSLERMRILSDGRVTVNNIGAYSFMFNSTAAGAIGAIIGASANGEGVRGQTTGSGDGVVGLSNSGTGVYGRSTTGDAVVGIAADASGMGVRALNLNANGIGLLVSGGGLSGVIGSGLGASIAGSRYGAAGFGRNGGNGTGLVGVGNGSLTIQTLTKGAGVAGAGDTGVYGSSTVSAGTGVIGVGNNYSGEAVTHPSGSGVAGTGTQIGVYGYATSSGNGFGGYFGTASTGFAQVGGWHGGTAQKILGNGSVSTVVQDVNDSPIKMFAPEAPEVLFQDYGVGNLFNGTAVVKMDPNLRKNIRVDENHPLKVFVQLEGDCNGVYVTEKSAQGFTVKELKNGSSNVSFSWQIIATRADEKFISSNGEVRISNNSVRFPPGPKEFVIIKNEKASIEATVEKDSNPKLKALATPVKEEKIREKDQRQSQQTSEINQAPVKTIEAKINK